MRFFGHLQERSTGTMTAAVVDVRRALLTPERFPGAEFADPDPATAADALNQNSQTLNAVIAAVKAFGVADADIQTTRINVFPIFSQPEAPQRGAPAPAPVLVGFRATNGIRGKTTDLSKVGDLIQTMVSAGITSFNGVEYGLQNPEQLRKLALQAAIADAQSQAQTAAASLGVRLGGVVNFTVEGSSAPPVPSPRNAVPQLAAASIAAPPPVTPGPLSATTHVVVTFAILGP